MGVEKGREERKGREGREKVEGKGRERVISVLLFPASGPGLE